MSRPLRIEFPNAWYHVMNRGRRKEPIFTEKKDYFIFLNTVKETCEVWHLRVAAYCLMPNHYHLLVQTPRGNISRCMRHIDGVYTQRFNRRHGCDGPLFRGRYKSLLIEEDTYLLQLVRYIHRNPLRTGLAERIDDYPWSSHQEYISHHPKRGWLHKELVLGMLTEDSLEKGKAYRRYMASADDEELLKIFLQRRLPTYLGREKFVEMLKRKFFPRKVDMEVPQSSELAPDGDQIIRSVACFYGLSPEDLIHSRRGHLNEPRNVAIYLVRKLRGDTLKKTGNYFGMENYSSVSSVVERMKVLVAEEAIIRERVEKLLRVIFKSQEQT